MNGNKRHKRFTSIVRRGFHGVVLAIVLLLPTVVVAQTSDYPSYFWRTFTEPGEIPGTPRGIVTHPNNSKAYVIAEFDDKVYEIDTFGTRLRTLMLDDPPWGSAVYEPKFIAINSSGTRLYVTCYTKESVFVIDVATFTVITQLEKTAGYPFFNPAGIAISPDDQYIFVANTAEQYDNGFDCVHSDKDTMVKIRTSDYQVMANVHPPPVSTATGVVYFDLPAMVVISPDGNLLFVGIYGCNSLAKRFVYVLNTSDLSTVRAIDCFISGQTSPDRILGMDLTSDNYLYVVAEYRSRLFRIDVSTIATPPHNYSIDWFTSVGTIDVTDPRDVVIMRNATNGDEYIFVSLSGNEDQPIESFTIKVYKHGTTPTFVQDITTPYRAPESMALTPNGNFLLVSHWDRDAVTIYSIYNWPVPTVTTAGLIAAVLLLGILIFLSMRRRLKLECRENH